MIKYYLVSYFKHDKTTDGIAYKIDFASKDIEAAEAHYNSIFTESITDSKYDYVMVDLKDSLGNSIMHKCWPEMAE